jgi:predicted ATP-dependent protease
MMHNELKPEQVRKHFDPENLGLEDTEKLDHLIGIIGQDRAVSALEFGLQMKNSGYNIYVAGPPGIGKMTSVEAFIEKMAKEKDTPSDICYVNNFDDSYNPHVIQLPAGLGVELKNDMDNLINHLEKELPGSFESDEYTARKEEITGELNKKREDISREISEEARDKGFSIQPSPIGIMIVPVKDGQPLKDEEYQSLSESEKEEIEASHGELQESIKSRRKEIRNLETEAEKRVKELDQRVALHIVGGFIDDLMEKYEAYDKVRDHLEDVQKDILENIDIFKSQSGRQQSQLPIPQLQQQQEKLQEMSLRKYGVNVVVDNSKAEGAPVIVEYNPTYNNLIGRIEKEMKMGALSTDFSMIRAGSILRANGGFLVLPIEDVLRSIYSYDGLKRTLRSGEIHIEELGERLGFMTVKSIRPEPVPVDVKVIVVGSPIWFYMLQFYDEDFQELFKVKADFDVQMDLDEDNIRDFMSFISTFCDREELRHLDRTAVSKVMEQAARMAGDQEKLSIKFGRLGDLIREADFWAGQEEARRISAEHVKKALDEKIYRSNLLEKRIQEMIERETILIDTEGRSVGQVNGLSVIQLDGYMFGRPSRITATVSPGRDGIFFHQALF